MEQTQTRKPDLENLEALLLDTSREPSDLVRQIRSLREACTDPGALSRDLDRAELQFLLREAGKPGRPADLVGQVGQAHQNALVLERRSLQHAPVDDPAALFDLAELKAECMLLDLDSEVEAVSRQLRDRIGSIAVGPEVLEEAGERWAALSTEEEDLPLPQKVLLMQETGAVLTGLAERTGNRRLRALGRRLGRAANDRVLALRLERALTPRGARLVETTSFAGLIVVLGLLLVEWIATPGREVGDTLFRIEAFICLFFILEFLFKLALAPARLSWFLRNALTDLLPAVPAVLFLPLGTGGALGENVAAVRALRLMRIPWAARYVQALRPLLRLGSLSLFLIRGLDGLVRRFSPLINRNFVFFEKGVRSRGENAPADRRSLLFRALRREQVLLADLPPSERAPQVEERARALANRLREAEPVVATISAEPAGARDIPVEHVVETLYALRPEEVALWIPHHDIAALDRVVRIVNAPLIRSLPILRRLRIQGDPATPEERVVALGRRIAAWLEGWKSGLLFVADLHGIVTGPQILDRVASAMMRASQRPAIRLLLFGSLFFLLSGILPANSPVARFLGNFVATPLVILGSVCFVVLVLGRWLKRIAGEASETFKLTSEAHFIALLHLLKRRHEAEDLGFLAHRIFRWEIPADHAVRVLAREVTEIRRGTAEAGEEPPAELREDLNRTALLYLHFLDGALLHESDIKSTEQLLANLSLENIRYGHLGFRRRDRKRLRRLSLAEGSIFSGPYLWFRFITQSVAVETAKRITDYNRHCLTLEQQRMATPQQREAMAMWMKRSDQGGGRTLERLAPPGKGPIYQTTEFNAMDFLSVDPEREALIQRIFGPEVLQHLRKDRRRMIREIFGTRPLGRLPRSRRSFNLYLLYNKRFSKGRVLLLPVFLSFAAFRVAGMLVGKVTGIVREILAPHRALARRESGQAPFQVALRKIHRMKAPGLVESMYTRVRFDPAYSGIPPTWSDGTPFEARSELERDMDFLHLKERERQEFQEISAANRRRVEELHGLVRRLPTLAEEAHSPMARRLGERAVTIAYMTNGDGLRTLFRAQDWFEEQLPVMESAETRLAGSFFRRLFFLAGRGFRRHPVSRWLRDRLPERQVSWRGLANFKRAYHRDLFEVREVVDRWLQLPMGRRPADVALERARRIYQGRGAVSRELAALRAVQSLSVLDVRNYRELVFSLGGFADEGEDPARATALP